MRRSSILPSSSLIRHFDSLYNKQSYQPAAKFSVFTFETPSFNYYEFWILCCLLHSNLRLHSWFSCWNGLMNKTWRCYVEYQHFDFHRVFIYSETNLDFFVRIDATIISDTLTNNSLEVFSFLNSLIMDKMENWFWF